MPTDVREIGKSRSQRINIDYYRQKNWLTRSRGLLAFVAVVLATAYCVYVYGFGGASHLSTGPVAFAHASFENDCQQCHLDFTPISGDALKFASADALDRLEGTCQECHRVTDHFRDQLSPEFAAIDQHCSGCHTDHQGREHDMVKMANGKCVQCHGDLPSTCKTGTKLRVRNQVQAFTEAEHGPFISLTQDDPGRIHFDHAQHMMPGQVEAGTRGGFTIGMLDPSMRSAYRKRIDGTEQTDEALVTLECQDCHSFAGVPQRSQAIGKVQVGDDEIGRHIEPIAFTKHCAACHSLTIPGQKEGDLPLPHAAPWAELETLMASKLIGNRQLAKVRMPIDAIKQTPRLGESVGSIDQLNTPAAVASSQQQVRAAFEASLKAGRGAIEQRCQKCHEDQDLTDESIEALRADKVPPLIPERWFTRGIYDHAAHRKIDCAFCHAEAYPKTSPSGDNLSEDIAGSTATPVRANDSQTVMIRGIESCSGCHRSVEAELPESLTDASVVKLLGGQSNWASDTCTECHRYHWKPPAEASALPVVAPLQDAVPVSVTTGATASQDLALVRESVMRRSSQ